MSINSAFPDYDLDERKIVSSPAELHAMADPLRSTILDLLLERAASVTELAAAVGRPKSTMAHHVNVLVDAGMLRVVRTRRVRAIDERFYGRTARVFYIGVTPVGDPDYPARNDLAIAADESAPAARADTLRAISRYVRIPEERAAEFWDRVFDLMRDFTQIPREGDTVYGFVAGLYPTDRHPSLPEPDGPR